MSATYRVITATALVYDVPQGRVITPRLRLGMLFQGYPAAQGWVVRVAGGYVRANAVTLVEMPLPLAQTGQHGLTDAVARLGVLLTRSPTQQQALAAAWGDVAAELIGRATSQSASVVAGLMERVAELETAIEELRNTRPARRINGE